MDGHERLLSMYHRMSLIRKYEERIYYLFLEGIMPGTIHQSTGQEACAVGMLHDLSKDDYVLSTHRPAGHMLAKGVPLNDMMAEMFAKANGCCKGKGGAMHIGDISVGAIPAIAIVGGGMPVSVGVGLSLKMRKKKNVAVCFFGDGATNEGSFHESLNAAAIWNLPVVFACENNLYGASTHIGMTTKVSPLARRADAYGIPWEVVSGNNVLEVSMAAHRAFDRALAGQGPTFLELQTYRICGHSRNDACGYRDKEEEKAWRARCPIVQMGRYLVDHDIATQEDLNRIDDGIEADIEAAIAYAKASPDPLPQDALKHVFYVEE